MSSPGERLAVSLRLLRRAKASQKISPKTAAPSTAAPTPMPALAPVDRPLVGAVVGLGPCVERGNSEIAVTLVSGALVVPGDELEDAVGVAEGVDVESGVNVAASTDTS